MKIPHVQPATWSADAGRFASTIRTEDPTGCAVALLGLPDDLGVKLNGGRVGAAGGPAAFRAALGRLGAAEPASGPWPRVFDAGDVAPGGTLEETHARVTAATRALLESGLLPIAIGGGHDLTFPFIRAVAEKFPRLAGIYFDAHLDVRETPGSGTSFRRLVEECGVSQLHLHGFRPFVNAMAHRQWFEDNGGDLYADGTYVQIPARKHLFASFDLDVLDMAYAPGVSAPNPCGWTPRQAERWVTALGACPRVHAFDLMELSPPHDEQGRTARLAAHLFLSFIVGYARRR